jgi:NhaA family Na+:H+ antiporter
MDRDTVTDSDLVTEAAPIDRLIGPLERFLHVEAAGGIVLLACTVVALGLANSPAADSFLAFWKTEIGIQAGLFHLTHSLRHWINDGLMVLFFFVVGLEVKREMVLGELRDIRRAALPIAGAIGGMVVPACVYLALQGGTPAARGWGVPMATDIAFVVGCMAVLGSRIPLGLRVMLLSLAIGDDIGAILVIAIGYSTGIHVGALLAAAAGVAMVVVLQRLGVRSFAAYTVLGLLIWAAFEESGVHATIAGVILGLLTPAHPHLSEGRVATFLGRAVEVLRGDAGARQPHRAAQLQTMRRAAREVVSPLEFLEMTLHPWVGFVVLPLFALANAGVALHASALLDPVAVAVAAGLVLGKPLGILLASWLAVRLGLARLPEGVGWAGVAGGGALAGIGFTMALFVAELALPGPLLDTAKVGIIFGSAVAALIGMSVLVVTLEPVSPPVGSSASQASLRRAMHE